MMFWGFFINKHPVYFGMVSIANKRRFMSSVRLFCTLRILTLVFTRRLRGFNACALFLRQALDFRTIKVDGQSGWTSKSGILQQRAITV